MTLATASTSSRRGLRAACRGVLVAAVGALGVLMAHHPMILSGLRRVQTDLGDTRFNNYILEHGFRWLIGAPHHDDFWSPPFFFPARNTAAHSDLMLGVAPVYAAIRALGLPPDTTFQVWMIAVSALNYLAAFHLLRRRLGLGTPASSVGAFLFAFGAPRINQFAHQQLLPQFWGLAAIDALFGLFSGPVASARARALLWPISAFGLVAQLYSGFYLGWFTTLALGIAAFVALAGPSTRGAFLGVLRRDAPYVVAAAILALLLLRPLIAHYLAASRELGPRTTEAFSRYMPGWPELLYMGPDSWLYGRPFWRGTAPSWEEFEKRLGIGPVTTLACAAGLAWNRGRRSIRLVMVVALIVFLCVAAMPRACMLGLSLAVAGIDPGRRDHPRMRLAIPALVLALLAIRPFTSEQAMGIGLFTLLMVLADLDLSRDEPRRCLVLAGIALGLCLWLFSVYVLALGAVPGALAACAAAVLGLRPRDRVVLVAISAILAFACLTSFGDRPTALVVGGSAPLCLALLGPARFPPTAGALFRAQVVALLAAIVYWKGNSAWYALAPLVPGASALRAISRAGLMLLIPGSIGLALSIEAMVARRRPFLAAVLAAACLLEQGVTTGSYDKDEHRASVAALARRIDRRAGAFYYTPRRTRRKPSSYHLDAMWAGLESGVPTINGYSGYHPPDWAPLEYANIQDDQIDVPRLGHALRQWARGRGLPPECIDWVGGPPGWRRCPGLEQGP